MNTKKITDKAERKKLKRAARKKAAPKAKRAAGVARGSLKQKVKKMVQGPAQALMRVAARAGSPVTDMPSSLSHQEHRRADRRLARSPGKRLRKTSGPVEPDRARHRRGHRLRHLHPHRHRRRRASSSTFTSICNAPVLDLLLHGGHAVHAHGPRRARVRPSRFRSCWWRSPAASRRCATPSWPP